MDSKNSNIDLSVIANYVGDDQNDINEIVRLFLAHSKKSIHQIAQHVDKNDVRLVNALSHKLKSSAKTAGAIGLANAIENLQNHVSGQDSKSSRALLLEIQFLMQEYSDYVLSDNSGVAISTSEAFDNLNNTIHKDKPYVLIVDDDPVSLHILHQGIQGLNVNILEASSGEDALVHLQTVTVSLILLDIEMPGMNGFELASKIANNPLTAQVPIIFVTEHLKDNQFNRKEYETLSVDYMLKPINQHMLKSKVLLFVKLWQQKQEVNFLLDTLTVNNKRLELEVEKRIQSEKAASYKAEHDNLTDLPNRFLALDRLKQLLHNAARHDEKAAVIFLDLDDFKKINDTLGHSVGDKLLIQTSQRLCKVVRLKDTVGRLGGDEFIILLDGLKNASDAQHIAQQLLKQFEGTFNIDGRELIITASIGIAIFPEDGDQPNQLLKNADSAMYHAKDQGRNTFYYFTEQMNKDVSRRFIVEEQMRGALSRGEFDVFYQPQSNLLTGKTVGAEALLRWNNPVLGYVSPVEFIPIAEQTGLILPIGEFVLKQALNQAAQWTSLIPDFCIAINMSPRQFRDPDLIDKFKAFIKQSGIKNEQIELEITEGVLMGGDDYISKALTAIHQLGISLAMDDFGTGYSSLSYLQNYPFNTLKIDRSFVNDMTRERKNYELINAIISMSHGLKLKVIAEGVETEEQGEILKALGCDYVQGYYYAKPMPSNSFTEYLKQKVLK